MKITKVECIPVTLPYKKPMKIGKHTVPASESVLVKLHTDEGITGIGESGHGGIGYTGDNQDSMMSVIRHNYAPAILLGENPFNIEKIVARMEKAARYSYQAMAVVDYALHDLVGKALGVPVYNLLGGLTNEKIRLGFVIGFGTPEETAAEAKKGWDAGYRSAKLKVGFSTIEADLANIKAIREEVGYDMRIWIDANCGWDYFQALTALKKMENYDIAIAEQPLPWWDIDGLANLRRQVRIPIGADEAATELNDLIQIVEKKAADVLFMKLEKVGGILRAQKWASIAKGADLPVMCGCMIGSGIGAAAQAHFLASNEWMGHMEHETVGPLHVHDVADTVTIPIVDDLALNVPRYENGYLYPPSGPGLGVELNEKLLPRLITQGKSPLVVT
jgi:L-alanine-DL-glutamate epimerase-like enolase superfamily enzyme